jgi:DNA helicase II / ATP-dependent DNA helicase PcrA
MPPSPAASFPGPDLLGRGVVVGPDAPTPDGYGSATRVVIDDHVLAHPRAVAAVLHHHWLQRRRIVIELAVDNAAARAPEVVDLPPYRLSPDLDLDRERLHALTWTNTYDLRSGQPIWWHGVLAQRRTNATAAVGAHGDITLPDGRAAWVDGGPRGPLPARLDAANDLPIVHRESIGLGRLTLPMDAAAPMTDGLASDQRSAVLHPDGPARVIAPAGSGKTRVLTARLRHLLTDRNLEPELITAVAYNTRAASELRDRTQGLRASIRTLHSLALWICNLDVRRQVIQERDVRGILDTLVRTARIPNQDPYQPYLEALSEVRLALRDPTEVEAARGDVDDLPEVFDRYRDELDRRGVLDFDEQVYRALELLLTRPDIRATAQQVGTHLLVDEFQDLTPAFLLLIRLVAGPTAQVFAVGDDDQTIYSYAGATPRYLVDIERWFPGARHHALEVNYRCPPAVVDAALKLLSHNRTRVVKTIRSAPADDRPGGSSAADPGADADALTVHQVDSAQMSAVAANLIIDRIADTGRADDIAVLARVNSALLPVQVALTDAGVAHTAPLDASILGRTGVRTALAYLRMGLDLERIRRDDLLDTINRPARKVKSAVQPLLRSSRLSMAQLEQVADALDPTHRDRFLEYLGDLRSLEGAITDGADTGACLRIIRQRIGLGEAMDALDSSRSRPEGSSHADDLDALLQLAALQPDPSRFRDWLADRLKVPRDPTGVTLSTVHRVKGMEWGQVVVFGANAGLFPHRLADDIEEERRVFHVAITRCRDQVTVVADRDRPSPFVAELSTASDRTSPKDASPPGRAPRPDATTGTTGAGGEAPRPQRTPDGTVAVRQGSQVTLIGGYPAQVVATDVDGIEVALDLTTSVRLRLSYGDSVLLDGRPTTLVRQTTARPGGARTGGSGIGQDPGRLPVGDDLPVDEELFETLRGWRARISADAGVPAYLVFQDRHLRTIAGRKPTTLGELAACPGVGPTKLERYGDDVLDLVDRHR